MTTELIRIETTLCALSVGPTREWSEDHIMAHGLSGQRNPLGFALENFDAVGAWRTMDAGQPIDAGAVLPDGTEFSGIGGLRAILLDRKDEFTRAFTERLMTYALGRGVTATDMPSVRAIARRAAADDYRIQTIIRGIVTSNAFTMRKKPESVGEPTSVADARTAP